MRGVCGLSTNSVSAHAHVTRHSPGNAPNRKHPFTNTYTTKNKTTT